MGSDRVVIVGAGVAGLVSAVAAAARGLSVTVLERAATPGGKLRQVAIGEHRLDAGPTVFTLRSVFEEIFAAAGTSLAEHVTLKRAEVLARHTWTGDESLDLFADIERSTDAIGDLAGADEARRFVEFTVRTQRIYTTLENSFIRAAHPSPLGLVRAAGFAGLANLTRISPFTTMWNALGQHFHDPRLRQLFGRYATYCGSSPFLAPATLMLVAHVEQQGVWYVDGGMYRLVAALESLAKRLGATFHYGAHVDQVLVEGGKATGVKLAGGQHVRGSAVVLNADIAAVSSGCFGPAAADAAPRSLPRHRSLSACTWNVVAQAKGFPLLRHTVFFSANYAAEFDDLQRRGQTPRNPTVYVCAQDREDHPTTPAAPERLLCLTNAPARGDARTSDPLEMEQCTERMFAKLAQCGLPLEPLPGKTVMTTPQDFNRLFPATGGALYGPASHGWQASFQRTGPRSSIPGLYFAGGSIHPGPGVPMAALSGQMAATLLLQDLDSTSRSRRPATRGGTSTR